jgi:type IV pilus assembly protein PilW
MSKINDSENTWRTSVIWKKLDSVALTMLIGEPSPSSREPVEPKQDFLQEPQLMRETSRSVITVNDRRGVANHKGFTLVEVLIAMLIGAVILAAVMTSFQSQHNTYLAQDQVVEMQQNARVAMDMLVRDIRSAGYDPNNLGAGITAAGDGTEFLPLQFTRCNDGTGALETIAYSLYDAYSDTVPPSNDTLVDDLGRNEGGGRQAVAENIRRLEFRYLDAAGAQTAVLDDIRSIQVSIMVQAAEPDTKTNPPARTYTLPDGVNMWNSTPGFRSVYLTTTVQCRNLGL